MDTSIQSLNFRSRNNCSFRFMKIYPIRLFATLDFVPQQFS